MRRLAVIGIVILCAACAPTGPPPAPSYATVGRTGTPDSVLCSVGSVYVQAGLDSYEVPTGNWEVVSFSHGRKSSVGSTGGALRLFFARPVQGSPDRFRVVAVSQQVSTVQGPNTFAPSVPMDVSGGDIVGLLSEGNNNCRLYGADPSVGMPFGPSFYGQPTPGVGDEFDIAGVNGAPGSGYSLNMEVELRSR